MTGQYVPKFGVRVTLSLIARLSAQRAKMGAPTIDALAERLLEHALSELEPKRETAGHRDPTLWLPAEDQPK